MLEARCCCSAALDRAGAIFVVGGGESMYRGARCLATAERLERPAAADGEGGWAAAPALREASLALLSTSPRKRKNCWIFQWNNFP